MHTHVHSSLSLRGFAALTVGMALVITGCEIEGRAPVDKQVYEPPPTDTTEYNPPVVPKARRIRILHTNDTHSHLLGFGPSSEYPYLPKANGAVTGTEIGAMALKIGMGADDHTVGGLVRRQYLINEIKAASKDPVLTLSAGDISMGTVFHLAELSAAPDFLALSLLGYDFMTLGNHEFDFGADALAGFITTANQMAFGAAVPIIATNMHFEDVLSPANTQNLGKSLVPLYGEGNSGSPIMPWATKVMSNGLKVGFVGLMGYEAALVAPGAAPVAFSTPQTGATCTSSASCGGMKCTRGYCVDPLDAPGHIAAMAADVQPVVDMLKDTEKVDVVVAMTHLGVQEDMALATYTSGIDVIIGGHSHDELAPTVVPSMTSGQSIIVQAGSYGTKLGELVIEVGTDGAISVVDSESTLHPVDYTLDTEILGDSDFSVNPPVIAPTFKRAIGITQTLIGPVIGGLNAQFSTSLGKTILAPWVKSDHDVIGEVPYEDTNLAQLVTDSSLAAVKGTSCYDADLGYVAVQANGVLRESLLFGNQGVATAADVFRVVPLGASPYQPTNPGYPLTHFYVSALDFYKAAEVGVNQGLDSDSFFLSYAGAKITYDPAGATNARVTKIELEDPSSAGSFYPLYDASRPAPVTGTLADKFQNSLGNPIDPTASYVNIVTNLYLAGFMKAFTIAPVDKDGNDLTLAQTVLCQTNQSLNCGTPAAPVVQCASLGGPPWIAPELKEWTALLTYLAVPDVLGGATEIGYDAGDGMSLIKTGSYSANPVDPRVIPQ